MSDSRPAMTVSPLLCTQALETTAEASNLSCRATVIIVNYNSLRYLEPCLSSLLASLGPADEVLLIDNASTDGSVSYVERAFPQVELIRSAENRGFGWAANLTAQRARGRILAFLNPDTAVAADWLDRLAEVIDSHPHAGLATSKILLAQDPRHINTCGNEVHFTGLTLCRGVQQEGTQFGVLEEVSAVSGAAFAIRRGLFQALGGFDESFFMYMEDTDLSWRARLAGYTCLYVPQSVVYHDYTLRFGPRKIFYQERNRYLMLLKCLRWPSILVLLPALMLGEAVTWGFALLRDRRHLMNKLQAYAWILRHHRHWLRSRREVQALRVVPDHVLIAQSVYRLDFRQTGGGAVAFLAQAVFDPLFFVLYRLARVLIRW